MNNSLRLRLELWLLLPLTLMAVFDVGSMMFEARSTARIVQERLLLGAARILGEQVRVDDGVLQAEPPPSAFELFVSPPYRDSVYYRIEAPDHHLLSGNVNLQVQLPALKPEQVLYFDTRHLDAEVHAVAFGQPIVTEQGIAIATVVVAQTTQGRTALAQQLWQRAVLGHLVLLVGAGLLLWVGLRFALRPLARLQQQLARRQPGTLRPLDDSGVAQELQPLVRVVNDYVQRLDAHVSAQERFIANAAHQLRTPLALLKTQVAFAQRSHSDRSEQAVSEVLRAMAQGLQHASRLVQQLLTLDLAHNQQGKSHELATVDLGEVVKHALELKAIAAAQQHSDLGVEGLDRVYAVQANPVLLQELVANLLDNAIRYAGANARITLRLSMQAQGVELLVMDNGPGIADDQKAKVFERFYRVHNQQSDGSGLGLAIVKEIAQGCGASVGLEDARPAPGLWVRVQFLRVNTEAGDAFWQKLKGD